MRPSNLQHTVYKTSAILFLIGLLGYFFNFSFNALLARQLSNELFGDFSVALRILNIASVYMLLGTLTSAKRFYSGYLKSNKMLEASKYMSWNLRIVLVSSLFFLILLALFTIFILGLHLFHVHDIREYHLFVYFLWLSPINAFTLLISSYLICDRDIYLGTFFDTIGFYLVGLLLLIPAIYVLHIEFHIESLWLLMLCIFIVMALLEAFILFNRIPDLLRSSIFAIFSRESADKPFEQEWWKVSKRLILNQLIYLLVRASDILLLEIISPDQKSVGYYAAALTVSGIFLITQTALFQAPSALFSSLTSNESDKPKLQQLINKSGLMNIILNVGLLVLIILFTNPILKSFGAEFIIAKIPLWILLGGTLITIFTAPAPRLLAYSGHEIYLIYIALVEVAVVIISGVILIYAYGAIGAAISIVITTLVRACMATYLVRKKLGVRAAIVC